MIKPATYWALHKKADPLQLGRIGLALANREDELVPPLSPAEAMLASVIRQDSDWMDERMDEQRQRWSERQRKKRQRDRLTQSACHRDIGDTPDVTIPPSLHPSIRPSVPPVPKGTENNEEEVGNSPTSSSSTPARGRTRGTVPALDEVIRYAADEMHHKKFDEDWAREWYQFMCASEPPFTDKFGHAIHNWRQKMISAWNIHVQNRRTSGDGTGYAPPPRTDRDGIRRGTYAVQTENKIGVD